VHSCHVHKALFFLSSTTCRKCYIVYMTFTLRKIESTRVAIRLRRIALNTCQQSVQALPVTRSYLLICILSLGVKHSMHTQARGCESESKDTTVSHFFRFTSVTVSLEKLISSRVLSSCLDIID